MTGYSNAVDDPKEREFFAEVKAEVAARKPKAIVLSDAGGHWFHVFCEACGFRGQALKDKKIIAVRAAAHDAEKHS